jgi:hypothetical protein
VQKSTAEWRTLATTVGSPLRMVQLTYLDKQNFLLIILEHQTNANGVGTCNDVAVAHLWLYRAAQGSCLRIGDVDAFPALKSRIKGR